MTIPETRAHAAIELEIVRDTIKDIGGIETHYGGIQPATSAQQHQQIEQLLRSHLVSGRLSVLRYDQTQFAHDLKRAQEILQQHYQTGDNRVSRMQQDLSEFGNIKLAPELPEITGAWNMLQEVLHKARKKNSSASNTKSIIPAAKPEPSAEVAQ